ncbi:prepilin peptidase [Enterococcus sp. AZ109]|uniref:prepilin peptidase n=1 Tax=Enterococcus sp. AZ109 TaxID=2774634 RepID=UPI003F1FC809
MQIPYFIVNTIVGSFLCLVVDRMPRQQSILYPRSHCSFCGHRLSLKEMIPIFSVILQKFRCKHCQHKLPLRYLFCEVFTGCLALLILPNEPTWQNFWVLVWLLSSFVLALIDYDTYLVEGRILLFTGSVLVIGALLLAIPLYWSHPLILIACFYLLQKLMPDSMGTGDLWVLALWSLFLSIYELLVILLIASASGILFYSYRQLRKKALREIPFLPFLFLGLCLIQLTKKA